MRVLDLGCGKGIPLHVAEGDEVIAVDINAAHLETARTRFPNRTFVLAKGEDLYFLNENSVDLAIGEVSLPYMISLAFSPKSIASSNLVGPVV